MLTIYDKGLFFIITNNRRFCSHFFYLCVCRGILPNPILIMIPKSVSNIPNFIPGVVYFNTISCSPFVRGSAIYITFAL